MSDIENTKEALWGQAGLFDEIWETRERQIEEKGYTHEHDDEHGWLQLRHFSQLYAGGGFDVDERKSMVKAVSVLISAIEAYDRQEKRNE